MGRPRHEPEVIRAKVSEAVADLRARLRALGLGAADVDAIALPAEKDAVRYAQWS